NTRKNRVMLLGTYRPEDMLEDLEGRPHPLETTMQNMSREGLFQRMELTRLDQDDTRSILASSLGDSSFQDPFLERIHKETGGNPFFLLEVLRFLAENGIIAKDREGPWTLVSDPEKIDIPSRIYDVVKRRLDRLMRDQREMLECASIIGEEFSTDILEKTTGMRRINLLKNLGEIEKTHHLIRSLREKYRFDHAKVREVLYNDMIEELRREYHKIVGDTILELHEDSPEEVAALLAHHYYQAKDPRAPIYLAMAGDNAKEKYANQEAMKLYSAALEASEGDWATMEKLADVQATVGEYNKSLENYARITTILEDGEEKARNLRKMGEVYKREGEYTKSLEVLEIAEKIVEEESAEHGRILLEKGSSHYGKGEYDKALELDSQAIQIFQKLGNKKDTGNALRSRGALYHRRGDLENAMEHYEKSLAVMESIGDKWGIGAVLNN
ncbi:MAG: tetratricopeptide repeat protein, partial [Candidatus Thermoplasmatota archaeon]|nr:tetratricopeptide repeat protein [Candidatus Thermoplasmatota archaeon]